MLTDFEESWCSNERDSRLLDIVAYSYRELSLLPKVY